MENTDLVLYNTLTRKKQIFTPINPPHVGMYVCGPTVYGEPHLGHARPAITFDILFRYLKYKGYKVRYVRNITDVGHLENDMDDGEDKIGKKARLEQLEPMEIAQFYTDSYHEAMHKLNVLKPSIEPRASGHIPEQIELIEKILENGMAYKSNGSVYFDVEKYNTKHNYGVLSGRRLEDLISNTRDLQGQDEKRNSFDFALWKKASPEHIMRWKSEWSDGFPGWHLECSAMSAKYLGEEFDIHGGGLDLLFPHHESEIAQSMAANNCSPAKFWVHNNLITINGQKMGKSLGNFITLNEMFSGSHELLHKEYSPMTIRFFILQAHYRSTLDFSNEALLAAEKGLARLMDTLKILEQLQASEKSSFDFNELKSKLFAALDDDLNTPILIANIFDTCKLINNINTGNETISVNDLSELKKLLNSLVFDILGLETVQEAESPQLTNDLMDIIIGIREQARKDKNWALSDNIRDELQKIGISIKDSKEGTTWDKA